MHGYFHRMAAALVVASGAIFAGTLLSTPVLAQTSTPGSPPVVVELFTSQGCNSCPPAEAFLGELADEEGILALELHVDYWD